MKESNSGGSPGRPRQSPCGLRKGGGFPLRQAQELPPARKRTQAPEHAATPRPHRVGSDETSAGSRGGGGRLATGHPSSPPHPLKPGHTEGRGLRTTAASPPSPTLPDSYRPGDGHGRPELGLAGGERRDSRRGRPAPLSQGGGRRA